MRTIHYRLLSIFSVVIIGSSLAGACSHTPEAADTPLASTAITETKTSIVTATPEASATPENTATPEPTATIKESPTATTAPTEKGPPPEGFADWNEAHKYGWVENADGKPEQHIVKNESGDVMMGNLPMEQLEAKYEEQQFTARLPDINGENPDPGFSYETIAIDPGDHFFSLTFHVKTNTELFDYLGGEGDAYKLEVTTNKGTTYTWNTEKSDSIFFTQLVTGIADTENIFGCNIVLPKDELVESFKFAPPGEPLSFIYEAQSESVPQREPLLKVN